MTISSVAESARSHWDRAMPYQRFLYAISLLFVISAAFHTVVFFVDGDPWQGPLSWRKPITFALSFALLLASLAWIMTFLSRKRRHAWVLAVTLSLASLGETLLITLQQWRGEPSHFNHGDSFDETVFMWMGVLILVVAACIVWITIWAFVSLHARRSLALAIKSALVLVVVGLGIGGAILREGFAQQDVGSVGSPVTFGSSGNMNLPHFLSLHALQVLPLLAVLLASTSLPEERRTTLVRRAAVAYAALVTVGVLLAASGTGPRELGPVGWAVVLASLATIAGSFAATFRRVLANFKSKRTGGRGDRAPVARMDNT